MEEQTWSCRLPTLEKLGLSKAPEGVDAASIAAKWIDDFSHALSAKDVPSLLGLFQNDSMWRDILALTWDFRTFDGIEKIHTFITERLFTVPVQDIHLRPNVQLQPMFPDVVWIVATFDFTTDIGVGFGVVRLVPTPSGEWKAFTMFTNLEDLRQYPENIGPRRTSLPDRGEWLAGRQREASFNDSDPAAIVIGGNSSGLSIAARLKYLNIPTLVVEAKPRVGDVWRDRYNSLSLHFPIHCDHMPYVPFPPTWPLYTPSGKMADWLEYYAGILDLNVWTSSTVTAASQDPSTGKWQVTIKCGDGSTRVMSTNHLVFATGIGVPKMPIYPGMDTFNGEIIHAADFKKAQDHVGKKVLIIGSGNSAHDVAYDFAKNQEDVTIFQRRPNFVMNLHKGWKYMGGALYREGVPTDIADRMAESIPQLLKQNGISQRGTRAAMKDDKELLDGLQSVGFKTNAGVKDTGFLLHLKQYGGGHVFETGTSQMVIDKKIKIKSDSLIKEFTSDGIIFENGSTMNPDLVVCATGYSNMKQNIRMICGDEVAKNCTPISGLNAEGEINGFWRGLGVKNLWYIAGGLLLCRFHSKHLALQIKAIEENVFGERYSLKE